jgi:putative hemolysin
MWMRGLGVAMATMVLVAANGMAQSQLANPASQNCVKQGGTLTIERRPDGGQYGVCTFADNYQCEEWALFRGECPKNGLRVTGYVTPAGRYCAITGGRYTVVTESASSETGVCSLPGGKACDAAAYYAGTCAR